MKKICLINGSLRGEKASSLVFLNTIHTILSDTEYKKTIVTVKAKIKTTYPKETLKVIAEADAIVLVFPVFVYCLPGALMRLLEDYYQYAKTSNQYNKEARVYVVINSGFVESQVTEEAIRVIKNFCRRLGLNWRFAISLGGGPIYVIALKLPILKRKIRKNLNQITLDIKNNDTVMKDTIIGKPFISKSILIFFRENFIRKK